MKTVVILGAHTALGEAAAEALEERGVPAQVRRATLTEHIGPGQDAIDERTVAEGDLFVLAFRGPIADGLRAGLAKLGKPAFDLCPPTPSEARWLWPGIDPDAGLASGAICVGPASPLVAALVALRPLGLERASAVTFESAAVFDRPGMDELSAQVRGVFTMNPPDVAVFPASPAFDVIPSVVGPDEDPLEADAALERQVAAGLVHFGVGALPFACTRTLVPAFSAEGVHLEVTLAEAPPPGAVEAALDEARTLRRSDTPLMPTLDAVGRDDARVGRVRIVDRTARLWMTMDRLRRGSATQVALCVERWLDGQDVSGAAEGETK